jgi:hypothetical protein
MHTILQATKTHRTNYEQNYCRFAIYTTGFKNEVNIDYLNIRNAG